MMKLSVKACKASMLVFLVFVVNAKHMLPSIAQTRYNALTTRSLFQNEVDEVIALLENCPYWTRLSNEDSDKADLILSIMEKISKYNINVIRKAVDAYLAKHRGNPYEIVAFESRVFILNRYVFRVSERGIFENGTFGGWAGVPHQEKEINWLWPLSYSSNGQLKLTGKFAGYFGPPYSAIAEFDYFYKAYGLRYGQRDNK